MALWVLVVWLRSRICVIRGTHPKSHSRLVGRSRCDSLVLEGCPPFRYGVSPNKLYDAYALGRPVITTVAGDINGEVEDHSLGVTAPPGDPQALAAAIQR